jgi:hypothetical protein
MQVAEHGGVATPQCSPRHVVAWDIGRRRAVTFFEVLSRQRKQLA